jgi:hypothetical protein
LLPRGIMLRGNNWAKGATRDNSRAPPGRILKQKINK